MQRIIAGSRPRPCCANLIDVVSKGGNYLLNVGPTAEGLIPQGSIDRLKEVGRWMALNSEAIYGTTASPYRDPLPWGRCTAETRPLYLHVFDWPKEELLVPRLKNKVRRAISWPTPSTAHS